MPPATAIRPCLDVARGPGAFIVIIALSALIAGSVVEPSTPAIVVAVLPVALLVQR